MEEASRTTLILFKGCQLIPFHPKFQHMVKWFTSNPNNPNRDGNDVEKTRLDHHGGEDSDR